MRIEKLTEASFGTMQKSMLRRSTDSYPKEEAAQIALGTVGRWLSAHKGYVMHVVMCCYDQENFEIYERLVKSGQKKQ